MQSRSVLSRRALLGLLAVSVVGCGRHKPSIPPKPAVVPDADALVTARNGERLLLASYDAKIAHASARELSRLQVARAIHATHLSALHGTVQHGTVQHGTVASQADIAVVRDIRRDLHRSAKQLRHLALAAQVGTNAALFASIAAEHEAAAT